MAITDEVQSTRFMHSIVPAAGAAVTLVSPVGVATEGEVVQAVTYIPVTAITGANTNSRTVTLVNKGAAGAGSTVAATTAYTLAVNATALAENALTLSGTPANLAAAAGDVLVFTSTSIGTGIADPGGLVRITLGRY